MKEVVTDLNMDMNGLIKIIADANHQDRPRVISAIYQALGENMGSSTLYIKWKYESELNI